MRNRRDGTPQPFPVEQPMNAGNHPIARLLLWCGLVLASAAAGIAVPAAAADRVTESDDPGPLILTDKLYSKKGADTCIKCHDADSEYPVFDIFKTPHGVQPDKRTPFATLQCESCHGPGDKAVGFMEEAKKRGAHVGKVRPGDKRPPILNFGVKSDEPVAQQNRMCLGCHTDANHIDWMGSAHQRAELACADCHTIHAAQDPVTDKETQPGVCFRCHQRQRAEFQLPSSHPVRFGQLACTDCHAVHGSLNEMLLKRPTLNETYYTCHAEKRGPFLWEHEPASEDCTLCHNPHGSMHPALLKKRPPLLCQQCHSQAGHPSASRTTDGLPAGSPSGFLLAGSCTNCHSEVHGSNHPSGVKLMR
jgi:DmsE family decaheme c-type cytochrome